MMSESTLRTFVIPSFTLFVADNVGHKVCSFDGRGTLHSMGLLLAQWRKKRARPKSKKACKGYEK